VPADPWVAFDAATDPKSYARVLRRTHAAVLAHDAPPVPLRGLIETSWQRALAAGVDPEHHRVPLDFAADDVLELRAEHPLAPVMPLLRHVLGGIVAADAQQVLVVSDAEGHVLWLEGHPRVRLMAEDISFVEGVRWTEATAGTNAVGTAIALDHSVQVFSAEHLVRVQHDWTCAAAPIHEPETGALLGVVDISGPIATAHPHNLALVTAAAGLAEETLRRAMHDRHERMKARFLDALGGDGGAAALLSAQGRVLLARPAGWLGERLAVGFGGGAVELPDGSLGTAEPFGEDGALVLRAAPAHARRLAIELDVLGAGPPRAALDGEPVDLSERHVEILALLALEPGGLTAEQLALRLYGEAGNPISARAEVSRLRRVLPGVVRARPYRLAARVHSDVLVVRAALRGARPAAALAAYPGPLLPRSRAPGITEARDELEGALRRCALEALGPELLWAWVRTESGRDDLRAHEALAEGLRPSDPRRAQALAGAERLRRVFGIRT
jgi:GAF domain-containing protein